MNEKKTIDELRQELRRCIEAARGAGFTVRPGGDYRDLGGGLCLLGAVQQAHEVAAMDRSPPEAAILLGVTGEELVYIEAGFEGWGTEVSVDHANYGFYALGREMREV